MRRVHDVLVHREVVPAPVPEPVPPRVAVRAPGRLRLLRRGQREARVAPLLRRRRERIRRGRRAVRVRRGRGRAALRGACVDAAAAAAAVAVLLVPTGCPVPAAQVGWRAIPARAMTPHVRVFRVGRRRRRWRGRGRRYGARPSVPLRRRGRAAVAWGDEERLGALGAEGGRGLGRLGADDGAEAHDGARLLRELGQIRNGRLQGVVVVMRARHGRHRILSRDGECGAWRLWYRVRPLHGLYRSHGRLIHPGRFRA